MDIGALTPEQYELFVKHLPFVRHLAGKVAAKLPASVDIEDLDAAGRLGLFQAVQSFDPDAGYSFMGFSKKRIRGAMLDEIRDMDWIGRTYRAKGIDLPSMHPFSTFSTDRYGDDGESHGGSNPTVEPRDEGVTAERSAEAAEMVKWFLDRLQAREARIVWAYHGPESMTYLEIAAELGISEGRVSHLYHRAIKKMRYLAEKLPHDPLD